MSLVVATTTEPVLACTAVALEVDVGLGGYRYLRVRGWDGTGTRATCVDLDAHAVRFTFAHADTIDVGRLQPVEEHRERRTRTYAEAASFLQCALEVLPDTGPEDAGFAFELTRRLHALVDRCRRSS